MFLNKHKVLQTWKPSLLWPQICRKTGPNPRSSHLLKHGTRVHSYAQPLRNKSVAQDVWNRFPLCQSVWGLHFCGQSILTGFAHVQLIDGSCSFLNRQGSTEPIVTEKEYQLWVTRNSLLEGWGCKLVCLVLISNKFLSNSKIKHHLKICHP